MFHKKIGATTVIRLERGEKVIETLLAFCEREKIRGGYFNGLGAADEVELAHFSLAMKEYKILKLSGQFEITGLHGNISTMDGKPYIHSHVTLGDNEFRSLCGHLKEAVVSATCEIILVGLEAGIGRAKDPEIGLNLLAL